MPFVSAAGANVQYEIRGEGPGLTMVHGTGFDAQGTFGAVADKFPGRSVVLPNLSGCGETTDDGGPLSVEILADEVAAVIRESGSEPVDLLGFSLGAVVSVGVAARHPELVRRLVLAGVWSRPDDEYLRNHMTTWRSLADHPEAFGRFGTLTAFSRSFLNMLGSEQVEGIAQGNVPSEGALRHIDLNLRADVRDLLPKIQVPTLVVAAKQDITIPAELAREVHEAIDGSEYAELDCGHVSVLEKADELADLVREFLDRD